MSEKYLKEFDVAAGYLGEKLSDSEGFDVYLEENNLVVEIAEAGTLSGVVVDTDNSVEDIAEEWRTFLSDRFENLVKVTCTPTSYKVFLEPVEGKGKEHGKKFKPM